MRHSMLVEEKFGVLLVRAFPRTTFLTGDHKLGPGRRKTPTHDVPVT